MFPVWKRGVVSWLSFVCWFKISFAVCILITRSYGEKERGRYHMLVLLDVYAAHSQRIEQGT